ncbi:hypothetical protein AAE478_004665 [Parahypoxylon ruwenzoriense]
MLAARDQENLAFSRQNGAALKQQQGRVGRQLQTNTPGARYANTPIKVPLNDENAAHAGGGAKSVLGARTKGNENTLSSKGKGLKTVKKPNVATPLEPHSRAPLGAKTTNAKAKSQQAVTVKSAVRNIEKSQVKAPTTRRAKQKRPRAELQKVKVHAEGADPLNEEEIEYLPPRPKDAPYESDVFPNGVLTFDALKPENLFDGFYDYYYNPVDEHGVPLADRQLEERNRKAMEECDKLIKEDMDNFEWSVQELDSSKKQALVAAKNTLGTDADAKKARAIRAPSTVRSRKAANSLSMDDTTKSVQRKAARSMEATKAPSTKTSAFAIPSFKRPPSSQAPSVPRKTSLEIEANSRTTIGYKKGQSTASILAQGTMNSSKPESKAGIHRSDSTLSSESDRTITPARFAHNQASAAAEDQEWKEKVPFLSIFNSEDDDDDDDFELVAGGMPRAEEDEEFVMKLAD